MTNLAQLNKRQQENDIKIPLYSPTVRQREVASLKGYPEGFSSFTERRGECPAEAKPTLRGLGHSPRPPIGFADSPAERTGVRPDRRSGRIEDSCRMPPGIGGWQIEDLREAAAQARRLAARKAELSQSSYDTSALHSVSSVLGAIAPLRNSAASLFLKGYLRMVQQLHRAQGR